MRVGVRVRVGVREAHPYVLIDLSMTAIFTATEPAALSPAGRERPVGPLAAPNVCPARLAPLAWLGLGRGLG